MCARENAFHDSIFAVSKTIGIGAPSFVGYSCFSIPHGAALVSSAYELTCKRKPLRPKGMRCGLAGKRETPTACDRVFSPDGSAYSH